MKFIDMKSGEPTSFTGYHWTSPERAGMFLHMWQQNKLYKNQGFFVSDDVEDWSSPWMPKETQKLIIMQIKLKKPYIFHNDEEGMEMRLCDSLIEDMKKHGYDAIISIPINKIVSNKQAYIFYPQRQIVSADIVD
jgi:hypothetical protein